MEEKTEQTPEVRKPYSTPVIEEMSLVPEETLLDVNCKGAGDCDASATGLGS
jgi:hypothetical protein